jgi:hypothetical protein
MSRHSFQMIFFLIRLGVFTIDSNYKIIENKLFRQSSLCFATEINFIPRLHRAAYSSHSLINVEKTKAQKISFRKV